MNSETSEEMIPGHGRQLVMSVESNGESLSMQSTLVDESLPALHGYDGFDDLTDDDPSTAAEY